MPCFKVQQLRIIFCRSFGHPHCDIHGQILTVCGSEPKEMVHCLRIPDINRCKTEVESVLKGQTFDLFQHVCDNLYVMMLAKEVRPIKAAIITELLEKLRECQVWELPSKKLNLLIEWEEAYFLDVLKGFFQALNQVIQILKVKGRCEPIRVYASSPPCSPSYLLNLSHPSSD